MIIPLRRLWLLVHPVLSYCALALLSAQVLASPVEIRLNLKAGTIQTWDFTKTRTQTLKGQPPQSRRSTTPLTSRVIEAGPSGYVVEWRFGKPKIAANDAQAADRNVDVARLLALMQELKYEVELTRAGEFVRLRNFEEVKSIMEPVMDRMLQQAGGSASPEAQQQMRAAIMNMVSSQEQFEAIMLRDLRVLLFPFGKVLDDAQTLRYEDQLPNPFGGAPLKVDATVALHRKEKRATIRLDQKLAPESIALVLDAFMKAMPALPQPSPEARKDLTADIQDAGRYDLDLTTGAIASASYSRTITAPSGTRVDTITFTRPGNGPRP